MLSSICFTVYSRVLKAANNTSILMKLNLTDRAGAYMASPRMHLDTLHRIQCIANKIATDAEEHGLRGVDNPTHQIVKHQLDLCSKCIVDALPDCDIVHTYLQTYTNGYPSICLQGNTPMEALQSYFLGLRDTCISSALMTATTESDKRMLFHSQNIRFPKKTNFRYF